MPLDATFAPGLSRNGLTLDEALHVAGRVQPHLPPGSFVAFVTRLEEGGLFIQVGLEAEGIVAALVRLNGNLAVLDFKHSLAGASAVIPDIDTAISSLRVTFGRVAGRHLN